MTCDSCKEKITGALLNIPEITKVKIDRENEVAQISMGNHVSTDILQDALKKIGPYTITMDHQSVEKESNKTTVKDLLPLLAIFSSVIALTLILNYIVFEPSPMLGMRLFMGLFFVIFGGFKMLNLKGFADAYQTYDLIAMKSKTYALAYPFIEIALGVMYLVGFQLLIANIMGFLLMVIGAYGVFLKLKKKEKIACACLGVLFKIPMTWVTLIEDLLMAAMALVMIAIYFSA